MATTTKWLPVVNVARCTGCGRCVQVCGLGLRRVVDGVAVLDRACECPGEALCQVACPTNALGMEWVPIEEGDHASAGQA